MKFSLQKLCAIFFLAQLFSIPAAYAAPLTIELSTLDGTDGFKINGINTNDKSGSSLSGAGDINGDGIDDFIIGTPYAEVSYVVFGRSQEFSTPLDLSSLNGTNGFRLNGAFNDRAGSSVSMGGDVNGDGIDDLLIGAPVSDPNGSFSGAGYIVFGSTQVFPIQLTLSNLNGSNGFQLTGEFTGDNAGTSVASAGDINGDGLDDIIIGSPGADPSGESSGASYVVFGSRQGFSATLALSSLNGRNGFKINGALAGDNFGKIVSTAGDMNGDGLSDIIIGADMADVFGINSGACYVIFGSTKNFTTPVEVSNLNGVNGFRINGRHANNYTGSVISNAGDINGDGLDDIIIGDIYSGINFLGRSDVVFGSDQGFSATFQLRDLNGSNGFNIIGETSNDRLGFSVSNAGDVNGDGIDDLLLGASEAGAKEGATYVVFGNNLGFATPLELASLDGSNGFKISGEARYDTSGSTVSNAGDVNNDGIDDILIGAIYADPNEISAAGATYVVFGQTGTIIPKPTPVPTPQATPNPQASTLGQNSTLSIETGIGSKPNIPCATGSCFGMLIALDFVLWTDISAGTDGGIMVGKNQLPGSQYAVSPSDGAIDSGELTAAWFFFGNYGTFFTSAAVGGVGGSAPHDATYNRFSDMNCATTACAGLTELGTWNVAWNGVAVPIGSASGCFSRFCSDNQLAGFNIDSYSIMLDANGVGVYELNYSNIVADGNVSGFGNVEFFLKLRGAVVKSTGNNTPIANGTSAVGYSEEVIAWLPAVSDNDGPAALTCAIATQPLNGTATVASDCSSGTYQSNPGFIGVESFTYTAFDGADTSAPATVTVANEIRVIPGACVTDHPIVIRNVRGKKGTIQVEFIGNIIKTSSNAIYICPASVLEYKVTNPQSSIGYFLCKVSGTPSAHAGQLIVGDNLQCESQTANNKSYSREKIRLNIRSGLK